MGFDRTTAHHAVKKTQDYLSVKDKHYVLCVNRWASIMEEFEDEINKVDAVIKYNTTEGVITHLLDSKYNEHESILMLEGIIKKMKGRMSEEALAFLAEQSQKLGLYD